MRRGTVAFAALEAVLLLAVPVLGWVGFRTVLDTTDGQAVDPELDPSEPGYEAFLEPTPVALLAGLDDDGALSWLTVAALGGADEAGGSLLFVPPATIAQGRTLAERYAADGPSGVADDLGFLLDAGFSDVVVLDLARMAALVAPVAPLDVVLADELPGFDDGEVALTGDEVAELLTVQAEGESDLARLARHDAVWRAWLGAVGASNDPNVVPGESGSGVGRYVRGLAAGTVAYDIAPVTEADDGFEPEVEALRTLVNERVPFPAANRPGARPRVRVLDGVGVPGLALEVARDVVRAGAQVTVLGNADRFDAEQSRVVYFDPGVAEGAEAVGAGLGIEAVEQAEGPNPNDLVDVTVVVGSDLAGAYGDARSG